MTVTMFSEPMLYLRETLCKVPVPRGQQTLSSPLRVTWCSPLRASSQQIQHGTPVRRTMPLRPCPTHKWDPNP